MTVWLACRTHAALGETSIRPGPFSLLQERLIEDGFDRQVMEGIYARPEVAFYQKGIADYFSHREATLDYAQFLRPSAMDQSLAYFREHRKRLEETEKRYGVEGEIITAILLVESRLGTFIGRHCVLNTLSSLAALGEPAKRDRLWEGHVKGKAAGTRKSFDRWASRKSDWAYRELKAYFKYVQAQNIDPFSLRGSYAGALGFAQFVPSSILSFGRDGNRNGQVNLHEHADAIESIANYLREHGWRPAQERDESLQVLLRYNHSTYYADTVLKVAERLKIQSRMAD
jgi:membrane-bound lytic murein transglycosylase B